MGSSASRQKKKAREEPAVAQPAAASGTRADDAPQAGTADGADAGTTGATTSPPRRKCDLPPIRRKSDSPGSATESGKGEGHGHGHADPPATARQASRAPDALDEADESGRSDQVPDRRLSVAHTAANIRKALMIPKNALTRRGSASSMYTNDAEKATYFLNEIVSAASAHLTEVQVIRLDWITEGLRSHTLYEHKINDAIEVMSFDRLTSAFISQNLRLPSTVEPEEAPVPNPVAKRRGSFQKLASCVKATAHLVQRVDDKQVIREGLNGDDAMAALIPDEARDLIVNLDRWNFDIFALDKAADHHPLVAVMYAAVKRLGLIEECRIDLTKLCAFCVAVEEGHSDFPYHSRIHAADVTQGVFWFISTAKLGEYVGLTPLDMYAMLVAGAIHDYNHLGVSNQFLATTDHELAIRYNNRSILESHATASAYEVINCAPTDPFSGLNKADRKAARNIIIECVMATDLCHHTDVLMQFKKFAEEHQKQKAPAAQKVVSEGLKHNAIKMAIKCADISNPARPYPIYEQWIHRVMAEFCGMGDVEKALGLASSPFCDSNQPPDCASRCQRGFINYIVMPLFSALKNFLPEVSLPVNIMTANSERVFAEDADGAKILVASFDTEHHGCILPTVKTLCLEHLLQDEGIN